MADARAFFTRQLMLQTKDIKFGQDAFVEDIMKIIKPVFRNKIMSVFRRGRKSCSSQAELVKVTAIKFWKKSQKWVERMIANKKAKPETCALECARMKGLLPTPWHQQYQQDCGKPPRDGDPKPRSCPPPSAPPMPQAPVYTHPTVPPQPSSFKVGENAVAEWIWLEKLAKGVKIKRSWYPVEIKAVNADGSYHVWWIDEKKHSRKFDGQLRTQIVAPVKEDASAELPFDVCRPITMELMERFLLSHNFVMTEDGQIYEKEALDECFLKNRTSPKTGKVLRSKKYEHDVLSRARIAELARLDADTAEAIRRSKEAEQLAQAIRLSTGEAEATKATTCRCGKFTEQRAYNDGFVCDVCGRGIPQGTLMMSCRDCNWDMCMDCKNRGVAEAAAAKVAEEWVCPRCTFSNKPTVHNLSLLYACEMCQLARPESGGSSNVPQIRIPPAQTDSSKAGGPPAPSPRTAEDDPVKEDEAPAAVDLDKKPESDALSSDDDDDDTTCVLCMDKERSYMCYPCCHRCICGPECEMLMGQNLLTYLKKEKCPICRDPVENALKVFGRRRLAPAV